MDNEKRLMQRASTFFVPSFRYFRKVLHTNTLMHGKIIKSQSIISKKEYCATDSILVSCLRTLNLEKKDMIKLNGIFPPLPTAFDSREELALDKMEANIKTLSAYNLSGFLALGSNGELVHLSEKEKEEVLLLARKAIPADKLMIAGVGGQSTRETIALAKTAVKAGADAVLVLNPFYFKGLMNTEALKTHYFAIADASDIPVIIYNMPANSGMDMSADTIIALSSHSNIIGMKDSGGNIAKLGDIRLRVKPDFQILAGGAGFLIPAMSIGAVGGILALANIAPSHCIEMYEAFLAGNISKARDIQLNVIPVNAAVTRKWGVPALKEAMDYLGLYGGPARKPILPLIPEQRSTLIRLLEKHNIKL
jgi:4-hydroxy-2-oxoglutarate aldolase